MSKYRLFFISFALLAAPMVTAQSDNHVEPQAHDTCLATRQSHEHNHGNHPPARDAAHHSARHTPSQEHSDHCALHEMHEYAVRHFGAGGAHSETFGVAAWWGSDWVLRWIDYEAGAGRVVRLYHLTNTREPRRRYLSLSDHTHGHTTEWEPVH